MRRHVATVLAKGKTSERDEVGNAAEESTFVALRQQADVLRPGERRQAVERLAVEPDLALRRGGEAGQHREQCRLAGAVGTEDAEHVAGFEHEIERLHQRATAGSQGETLGGETQGRSSWCRVL